LGWQNFGFGYQVVDFIWIGVWKRKLGGKTLRIYSFKTILGEFGQGRENFPPKERFLRAYLEGKGKELPKGTLGGQRFF